MSVVYFVIPKLLRTDTLRVRMRKFNVQIFGIKFVGVLEFK